MKKNQPSDHVIAGEFLDDALTEAEWNRYVEEDLKRYGESSGRPTDEELGMSKSLAELFLPSRQVRKVAAVVLAVLAIFLLAVPTWDFGRYLTGDSVKGTIASCDRIEVTSLGGRSRRFVGEDACVLEWRRGGQEMTARLNGVGLAEGDRVTARVHGGDAYRFPQVTMSNLLGIGALVISVWFFRSLRRRPQS